jgi:hypothetical protein
MRVTRLLPWAKVRACIAQPGKLMTLCSELDRDRVVIETERHVVVVVRLEDEKAGEGRLVAVDERDRQVRRIPAVGRAGRGQLCDDNTARGAKGEHDLHRRVSGRPPLETQTADLDVARRSLVVLPGAEAERNGGVAAVRTLAAVLRQRQPPQRLVTAET